MSLNVQVGVHGSGSLGSNSGLGLLHVPRTEQELAVQVGPLDVVHVGDKDLAFRRGSQADHGHVLEELASDGASAHDHVLLLGELGLEVSAKDGHLPVVARAGRGADLFSQGRRVFRKALSGVKVEPLLDRHELAGASFHHFLGSDAADGRCHGRQVTGASLAEQAEDGFVGFDRRRPRRVDLSGELNELGRIRLTPGPRQAIVASLEFVQSLEKTLLMALCRIATVLT